MNPERVSPLGERGFSLTELLVATVLVLLVVGALLALANPAGQAAEAQPEAIDMQQRARFGAGAIFRDLHAAGAGLDRGPIAASLGAYFAPVLPRRIGGLSADGPPTARSDVISVVWVPETPVQATMMAPFSTGALMVRQEPGCPPSQPACGIQEDMGLLLFDRTGRFDLFTVEAVTGSGVSLRRRGTSTVSSYDDGAFVAEVLARTYYVDLTAKQLRRYDSDLTDVPVMDGVTGMAVEYFGHARPPTAPKPLSGQSNCLYGTDGSPLPGLQVLPAESDGLARLPLDLFRDGPWCGEGDTAYDADLLRIRRVRIVLGVQASSAALRAVGGWFSVSGTSQSVWRAVPDVVVAFEVAPRNLALSD